MNFRYGLFLIHILLGISIVGCHRFEWRNSENTQNTLIDTLESANYQIADLGTVSHPFFAVDGRRIQVAGEQIQIFEFPTVFDAIYTTTEISSDGFTIGGQRLQWMGTPHFYRKRRVIVFYLGDNVDLIAILENVLGSQFAGGISYPDI